MANENKNVPAKADLTRLKALLGSGLVLSTERIEDFEAMLAGAMEAIGPRDFMEEILVFDVVNATFDIFRYQRHKVLGSERLFKASLAADAERRKKELERKKSIALKEEEARERTENPDLADQKRGKRAKHEITSTKSRGPEFIGRVMQIAEAICGDGTSPEFALYAGRIAEAELLLQVIRTQRVSIIDRLRHPFLEPLVKGDRTVAVMEKFIAQADLADGEYSQLIDQMQKNKETFFAPWPPRKLEPNEPAWKYEEAKDRDEVEAMDAALPDLERLLRYERRILSRRKRAVLDLIAYNFAKAEPKDDST